MAGRLWRALIAGPPGVAIAVVVALATYLLAPGLFGGEALLNGDSATLSAPLLALHARALAGDGPLLWTAALYGGHPLFAEGQGGFAHPLNMAAAGVLVPLMGIVQAKAVFHWVIALVGGVGVAGLARSLGISPWGAAVAAIAAAFSNCWIAHAINIAVFHAIAWTPWALWAMEAWIKRPTGAQGLLLGAACAAVYLAGYPMFLHGLALYMAASLAPTFLQPRNWAGAAQRIGSGALAVAFFFGVCAVQWAPMFELVGLSARARGIDISITVQLEAVIRGALFAKPPDALSGPITTPFIGSALVCVLATIALLGRVTHRMAGHLLGTILLTLLGGTIQPFFGWAYSSDLIPGLHFFRLVLGYLMLAVIGIGVFAGAGVDVLSRPFGAWRILLRQWRFWLGIAAVCAWVVVGAHHDDGRLPRLTQWILLLALLGVPALAMLRQTRVMPVVLCALLGVEAAGLRPISIPFFPMSIAPPAALAQLAKETESRLYKATHVRPGFLVQLRPPHSEGFFRDVLCAHEALVTATNTYWGMRSIEGDLALPMARRALLDPVLEQELRGREGRAGARVMDVLSIRYVAFRRSPKAAGFEKRADLPCNLGLYANTAARPLFQVYEGHQRVSTPEQALAFLRSAEVPTLVLEPAANGALPPPTRLRGEPDARVRIVEMSDERYIVRVESARAAWLFLSDANYPGWRATVDGADTPVFTAQVLGKAIAVPAGEHEVVVWFRSDTVQRGFAVTLATLLLTLAWLGWRLRRVMSP